MTSGFEFAGPYFLREVPLDGKFLHDILFQVISVLEKFLFHEDQAVQDASTPSTTLRMRGVENDKGGGKEDGRIPVCVPQTNPRNSVATESEQREDRGYYRNK